MSLLRPLPISHAHLERYRLGTRRQKQPEMVGGHQMRRKGQSLEFYEYQHYVPGDDIRHVDWRASVRHGGKRDLLVKNFAAEEQMTLVISIDTRPSMCLPQAMPKFLIAAWLAEAVARITLRSEDRVVLHRLFGKKDPGIEVLKGASSRNRIRRALNRLDAYAEQYSRLDVSATPGKKTDGSGLGPGNNAKEAINLAILDRYLPPSAIWLIITDFYFDMAGDARKLANRMITAQDGWRWLITMDLDSWPWEKQYLGIGGRRIEGPGLDGLDNRFRIDDSGIREVEKRINEHKVCFHRWVTRESYDRLHWQWPEKEPNPDVFFRHRFGEEKVLERLFMKGKG